MIDKKVKTALIVGIVSTYIAVSYPVSTIFITLLLGLIFVPPILVFVYVLKVGIPLISNELKDIFSSENEMFVISVSKEHITIKPEHK